MSISQRLRFPSRTRTHAVRLVVTLVTIMFGTSSAFAAGGQGASSWPDTLWIFDADFEDLLGDNEGWEAVDLSGTPASENYWHKDTIRLGGGPYHLALGDSTWWCGTYDDCGVLTRGYGNNWTCSLERAFPEVPTNTDTSDVLVLEWDHRYAIEGQYDYGYVDVSKDSGSSWSTIGAYTNPGSVLGYPGYPVDWVHTSKNLDSCAGRSVSIRFRFVSDYVVSSQDMAVNDPYAFKDGAWQLDNIHLYTREGSETITLFLDDCESPGSNGWAAEDEPASGQTGVAFRRSYEEFDGHESWMMAAYDTSTGVIAPRQFSWLYSPPVQVSPEFVPDGSNLIVQSAGWIDIPDTNPRDYVASARMTSSEYDCVQRHMPGFQHIWSHPSGGPHWATMTDTIHYSGGGWLGLAFYARGHPYEEPHGVGFVIDRVRVGVPPDPTGLSDGTGAVASLSRALPNPLRESTSISYVTPARGHVTLRVFSVAGCVVATLVNDVIGPGEHIVVWDGKTDTGERAASGVYFLQMELDGAPIDGARRKVVLLK
jgi:hypothetical protein